MSSTTSESERDEHIESDDSEINFIPGPYNVEKEDEDGNTELGISPYADEPEADEEWLAQYAIEKRSQDARIGLLESRLENKEDVNKWCTCGKCDVVFLQNPKECLCCKEIDECVASLSSDLVLQEVESPPSCITDHPGFKTVCLDKWSLRLTASKLKTRSRKEYRQKHSEEMFFRSVAYRSFVWLVYGRLGKHRYPLPACAYDRIRRGFLSELGDDFVGFVEDE